VLWTDPDTTGSNNQAGLVTSAGQEIGNPSQLTDVNGQLYFAADASGAPNQLWTIGATGPRVVTDVNGQQVTIDTTYAQATVAFQGQLFFSGFDSTTGTSELWESDGTPANTFDVTQINATGTSADPHDFAVSNNLLYFAADNGADGDQLWVYDPSPSNPSYGQRVLDGSGRPIDRPAWLTDAPDSHGNDTLYFYADNGNNTAQLWKLPATSQAAFAPATPVQAAAPAQNVTELQFVNDTVFFVAHDSTGLGSLWQSDGTAAGTVPVPAAAGTLSNPSQLTVSNSSIFFAGSDGSNGNELWQASFAVAPSSVIQFSPPPTTVTPGQTVTLTITRSDATGPATVTYQTAAGGTGQAGTDFQAIPPTTLSFRAGEQSKAIQVQVLGTATPGRTVQVQLSAATGGVFPGGQASLATTLTIAQPKVSETVQFSSTGYSVREDAGSAVITMTRSNGTGPATVRYTTNDPAAPSGQVTFGDGDVSQTIVIPVHNDGIYNGNQVFTLTLSRPTGGPFNVVGLGQSRATLTITEVTPPPPDHVFAQLVTVKVRKTKYLVIQVIDRVTGALVRQFTSPFQKPAFTAIQVSTRPGFGGAVDTIFVTARKRRRLFTATFPG
jgi:ELWxxDGT repeat protein